MEIVVNDTNILIQRRAVDALVADGALKVRSLSGRQMMTVMEKVEEYDGKCNLSPEDISVMVYAKENGYRLLTGDKTLRTKAIDDGVSVSGILYLTDRLMEDNLVTNEELIFILQRLMNVNKRLPKKTIEERIEELKVLKQD